MDMVEIRAGYPAWKETEKIQRNQTGTGFADRIADMD